MAQAAVEVVRFHCPACGAGLRASSAAGGTVTPCHQCGEPVRTPRRMPPREVVPADAPFLPPADAGRAAAGCRVLRLALLTVAAEVALVAAAYAAWAAEVGPASLFTREPGRLAAALAVVWAVDLCLVAAQTALKSRGYRLLSPAAVAVNSAGWVTAARVAVGLRAVGYTLATVPWLTGVPADGVPITQKAVAQIGHLAWMLGLVFEFAVVVVWYRLFAELGGPDLTRTVSRYLTACGAAFLTLSAAVSVTLITVVAAVRRATPDVHVPGVAGSRLNFAALPAEGYLPVWVAGGLAVAIGAGLAVMYWRLLETAARELRPVG